MCGIVAQFNFNNSKPLLEIIKLMAADINHRGPDDEGFYIHNWVGIGFKRLSILDVSENGHQPMKDETGNFIIAMNGEVYNFKNLRSELLKNSFSFRSQTDTEVVLNGYKAWGTEVFSKLQGMFAIIIYDKTIDEIIVARDQLGIKPLYYYRNEEFAIFGSEIKSFRHKIDFEVNQKKLYEQFVYGYVSGGETIFKDIYRILPGTYHRFNKKGLINETTYYNVTKGIVTKNYKDVTEEEIKFNLKESILQHTISDVGYNIQLSGGVDSSYITAVLAKDYSQDLHTFSIELDSYEKDESEFQKIVANKYNTNHHGYNLGAKDLIENYEKATWHHDIPIVHTASVFLMLLCEQSRKNSKVILTGEGADELFGGYSRYQVSRKYYLYSLLAKNPFFKKYLPNISKLKNLKNYLNLNEFGIDEAVYFSTEKLLTLFNNLEKDLTYRKDIVKGFPKLLHKIIASDQTSYLNWLFERQDKMSMAMSVESRVPFSNHLLFNLLNSVEPKKKVVPYPKTILKIFAQEYFDNDFIHRRKNGFVLPYAKWLRDDKGLKQWMDYLTDKTFKERAFYDHKSINRLIQNHLKGETDNSKYLLPIINFEIWHRVFIDN